ncbi:hypothetical protein [Pelagicoccus mobilis]|uniref:Uncharacterized protein n=1 Tax=Pelagicoccus mobilis TaxID=415221 RepID=A0A934VTY9_9BACT|nr:hypothetical protein [Pelagicoccus mobilis]MBK1880565.1 hypothetical protein [Pelagicoccus mobilis]
MSDDQQEEFNDNIAPQLEYFAERTNLMFAYYFCTFEFIDDEDFHADTGESGRSWSLSTIQNACLHTSLLALRDIDDFFKPRDKNTRPDDMRASDFGATTPMSFLSKNERLSINKLIAHSTYHGAPNLKFRWDILELMYKAEAQISSFIDFIKTHFPIGSHTDTQLLAILVQKRTKSTLSWIRTEIERRKSEPGSGGNAD